ncbi:MAG: tetratricopeptide repeat protein [Bacteroidia bacterium]|nr:tetratricopeptide repeat protein [Bacteroidia bacterium]
MMKRKNIFHIVLLASILLTGSFNSLCFADSSQTKFANANALFQKQDYDVAIKAYSELISLDSSSAKVWFNLGNSFFRKQEFAQAIICFERAKRISPADEDIIFNLRMANLHISDKIDPLPRIFYLRWIDDASFLFSISEWSMEIVISFFLMLVFVLGYFLLPSFALRKVSFFSGLLMLLLVSFSYALAMHQQHLLHGTERAVITAPSVYVKSSPDEKGTDLFILHDGTAVDILDELNGWKKIRIANGNIGWVLENTFEVI